MEFYQIYLIEFWKTLAKQLYNHTLQEKITDAISHLRQGIKLDSQCLEWAKTEINFDKIREDNRFLEIVNDRTTNLSENF